MEQNFMNDLYKQIAKQLNITTNQINAVLKLLEEGSTVPFIARYRKEVTGALDEEQIREISKTYEYGVNLQQRKDDVIRLIDEKGMLTPELKNQILKAEKLTEIEDLYRPFKEKKKTRATMAKAKGLEPLAQYLLTYPQSGIEVEAAKYVNEEVASVEEALQGARDIIAEMIADNADYRKWIREYTTKNGEIQSKVRDKSLDERHVYEQYYEYSEPISRIVPHRVLAMNRGESEKILRISITENAEGVYTYLSKQFIKDASGEAANQVMMAIEDAYKRLIKPSIEREIRASLKEVAENQAIHIFSENVRQLLLQPPMKGKVVLGVDPAFRTGCKLAVVDETGKVLDIDVIYPHEKSKGSTADPKLVAAARAKVIDKINTHKVEIVSIGNGTASRETESFIVDVLKEIKHPIYYIITNEAGASVYSASDLARQEFPDLQVEERSAVSIARRLQDPLAELVKIDPKSIGVGQYQHDVTQSKLNDSLNFVVETTVNQVGVNVNTASPALLKYVAGLSSTIANNIVKHRDEVGKFTKREELKKVARLGAKTYEQAIGFLRIIDGVNPLDKTGIHPESYKVAEEVLESLGCTKDDLGTEGLKAAVAKADRLKLMATLGVGEHTLNDILDAFVAPNRDPRDEVAAPLLRSDVLKLEDLKPGMELQGTVRNVVDFGVFVDCGVKEDGLVHLSKMKKGFVKHPMDVASVGDIVKVWVESVDLNRKRLALTMIMPEAK
ncbi:S1 RNA-binding domain-containing protein [Turicibacter sanguinis]|uniref:S1 RNA-binding domain-containing protein n=3 Tax=Bacteria TaxID=2 RepID=A0A9X5AMP8_9FIRM|nr:MULTISPECIES: Tex family protein [Turicibacter]EFF63896.1 S1 RNA binding domain protein [Turicibacter sanguinis PC909]MBP3903811.1 RNA-binding transcriptional accessory protein [Turicibacter sp.]MDB8436877.1 Tex family protein [Turicibacter sanguinis]MDB8457975.1 Tex family protein [Turicibacter sanguinis]MDB8541071.1 Tex family protein [Turicibacter sanguinis]